MRRPFVGLAVLGLVLATPAHAQRRVLIHDALIYDEIPKPMAERLLTTLHLPLREGDEAFAAWAAKADKVAY